MESHIPSRSTSGLAQPVSRMVDLPISGRELWRGMWVIFWKHMQKFLGNSMEIGGTLGWPLLWMSFFAFGMGGVIDRSVIGFEGSYLAFITSGIMALTALSAAVNSGMTLLEEKIRGILQEYFVAPIPRLSILLAQTASGLTKSIVQSLIVLGLAVLSGVRIRGSLLDFGAALIYLLLYVMVFVGFSNGIAIRSRSVGEYHMLLFVLNLPLLFLSNALYPLAAMPTWMRFLAYLNPTTYAVDGMRQALFGGGTLPAFLGVAVLAVCALLGHWYGLRSFRVVSEGR